MRGYFGRLLIGIDQFLNIVFGGFEDETISSRLGREKQYGDLAGKVGCAILDALDPNHCSSSIEETPEGETDPHHLGRVIYELPPKTPLEQIKALAVNTDALIRLPKR